MNLNLILSTALTLIAHYKEQRDKVKTAGDPTTADGELLDDRQLAELLRLDGVALETKIDGLIAKHSAP